MRTKLAIIGAAVCLARAAFAITMASQPWTMNRIAEAEARIASNIVEAIDAIPAPDFSQNNSQLRETIVAVSPPADLTDATNHTRAALSAFAGTGTVERARSYGTPTRWTDASGDVWEIVSGWRVYINGVAAIGWLTYSYTADSGPEGDYVQLCIRPTEESEENGYPITSTNFPAGAAHSWNEEYETQYTYDYDYYGLSYGDSIRILHGGTNHVGRVALTNDIPATLPESDPTVPSWAKAEAKPSYSWNEITGKPQVVDETGAAAIAETVIREKSLGGIWDTQLEVWWTPVMRNGALTYQATTNVNLNAEN